MNIAKTFGTLTLGAMGLMNGADATAQDTKTASKPEPNKVVKFIANENEATLVSKSTNAELAGRARVEASTSKPIELTETELKERAKLIEDFSYLLPSNKDERKNFIERSNNLSNTGLGTLFRGTRDLMNFGLIDSTHKETLFRSENLLHSANLVGKAANVYEAGKASAERTKEFIFGEMTKLKLVTLDLSKNINDKKLANNN